MKGKIISLILVFFISFSLVSGSYQKKVEASSVVLGYAAFKAGVAFTGFVAYAGMLYANGYNMGIQEMIVGFANKYYDYANGQYIAKGDKMNFLDKLNLATSSFLTGNDYLTYSELDAIKNDIVESYPQKIDISDITHDLTIRADDQYNHMSIFNYTKNNNSFYEFDPIYEGKIMKLTHVSLPDYFFYIRMDNLGYEFTTSYNAYLPKVNFIMPNGQVFTRSFGKTFMTNIDIENQTFDIRIGEAGTSRTSYITNVFSDNYNPVEQDPDFYEVVPNSFASNSSEFVKAYPNYYPALSGKASTTEDLENLMNTDEYLQREITALIENQAVNTENNLEVPLVDGGVITYPDSVVTDPDVPYVPGSTWYDNILDGVTSIPDLFIGKMTDLIDDKITPALESLKNTVLTIPDLISNIWQWILDFPDLLYSWFVPTAPMIAETWDPVMDLWDLKLDPIIGPFKTLTFYESEYQDISVPLKFGSYEKEHKIIDFQYVKSQRDTIKSLIRAFLWILIIFFNLDQIHRLIRNQSLLNTYVRKIDKGA